MVTWCVHSRTPVFWPRCLLSGNHCRLSCFSVAPTHTFTPLLNTPVSQIFPTLDWLLASQQPSCYGRHHRVALAADPHTNTVQAVSTHLSGTERTVTKLHRRAVTACHHKTFKCAVSRQERPACPTDITEVWGAGVQCCWSHSLEQPSVRH